MQQEISSKIFFNDYQFIGTFTLPETDPSSLPLFDILNDGRIISTDGQWVYVEQEASSRVFDKLTRLNDSQYSPFIRISPNGNRIATAKFDTVVVFNFDAPEETQEYRLGSTYDAEWIDDSKLAITGASQKGVTVLDTENGRTLPVIQNIGGAPAGVTIDKCKYLYCANGGDTQPGGSQTGWIKAFPPQSWETVLSGGVPIDFETSGILVADILSAGYLGFDGAGNMLVGGGVFFGGSGDVDGGNEPTIPDKGYAAIINGKSVKDALEGGPPVTRKSSSNALYEIDPDPNSDRDFYYVNANRKLGELYFSDYGGDSTGGNNAIVYVFRSKSY
ncbi:hypothetical protein SPB21_01465 [Leptothoe sp. ISB3NOV94-8A]